MRAVTQCQKRNRKSKGLLIKIRHEICDFKFLPITWLHEYQNRWEFQNTLELFDFTNE